MRTGVTVIQPHPGPGYEGGLAAGAFRLNGNGEMTGLEWIRETGLLVSPIALTNTHSLGVVRDALIAHEVRGRDPGQTFWALPVVAETYDGLLSDIDGQHVRAEHVEAALAVLSDGPPGQGSVGGGTGTIAFGFKAGIGTSSRIVPLPGHSSQATLGVLVQANHGRRERLRINGVPVGRSLPGSVVPIPEERAGAGSVIVVVATDAPLHADQCRRIATRAALGVARGGGTGENDSGDLILAFSTASRIPVRQAGIHRTARLGDVEIDPLFDAVIDATEEAILNSMLEAATMVGRDGHTAYALPAASLLALLRRAEAAFSA